MRSPNLSVTIPLINPNEPEARLVSLEVSEGQFVKEGQLLCTLETTKSTAQVLAETDGYVVALQFSAGDTAPAGAQLCFLAESRDWLPEESQIAGKSVQSSASDLEIPAGLRISQPALQFAITQNLDLNQLPKGPMLTESMIKNMVDTPERFEVPKSDFNPTAIIIYGGGGHGKSVIDAIRAQGIFQVHGIVDDGIDPGEKVLGSPVLGGSQVLPDLLKQGIRLAANAVGGIGDIRSRIRVFQDLSSNGFTCPTIIHPSAVIESSVIPSAGMQVFPHAYIGSDVRVGYGVIVNTAAVVSHDCFLGDYANISPGALLAGGAEIGSGTLIGMGVTINLGVKIGNNARIGNSAVIKADVPENGIVQAGMTWPE
jgi:sugar O-acyltransferase (sialic acid O-acetyltransferase NeuD family)